MNNQQPPGIHNDPHYTLATLNLKYQKRNDGDVEVALEIINDSAMRYADKYKPLEREE